MEEAKANNWGDHIEGEEEEEEELVRELLDDESPFFLLPQDSKSNHQSISTLISTVYSGPTILDIENALSLTTHTPQSLHYPLSQFSGFSKIENNKYTLKLKTCGNGMADDGYKWRKYGQKSIKNSPFPRSYYRCTNPRCSAKKQVERSTEEENTVIITYEGLHLHFAYPYLVMDQPQFSNSPTKKAKKTVSESEAQKTEKEAQQSPSSTTATTGTGTITNSSLDYFSIQQHSAEVHQGLLEDVVPFIIRNPSNINNINASSNSSTCSSYPSPPISPSFSWSPNHSYSRFDVGIM